jgi:hypothetical protein
MYNSKNKEKYDETLRNQKNETFNAKENRKLNITKTKQLHSASNNKQRILIEKEFLPNLTGFLLE